jgi:Tfp pilus assembly protein PilF
MARKTSGRKKPNRARVSEKVLHDERQSVVRPVPTERRFDKSDFFIAAALLVVTLAVYAQVIGHQFINLDDDLYVWNNPVVARGLTASGIGWAFTTFHAANWHPLTWISHMVDCQLFGLHAGGHLLVNVLIHVTNSLLLFFFLRRVTGTRWRSAIVAALFALHPLHVESVAWAAERKDTLSTFFGLLCLLAYARYVAKPSWKSYAFVALWLALGLMAKPMLVTWPFVLLLLDYWPFGRPQWQPADGMKGFAPAWWPLIREKLVLFVLVGASIVMTYIAQSRGGAVRALVDAPLSLRVSNAIVSYAKYFLATFWPGDLAVYYPFTTTGIPASQVLFALILLAAISVAVLSQATARPYFFTGWFWFLGTLVPVIGLVQVGGQAMADRYHYLPSIGLFVSLVFGVAEFATVWRIGRTPIVAAASIVILICASLTARQVTLWRDSVTLFEHTLAVTPDNLVIQYNLGHVLGEQRRYEEARIHFAEALRIKPDFFDALINMGMTLTDQGHPADAVAFFERALRVAPNSSKAHTQLAIALARQEKKSEALAEFRKAVELAPRDGDARANLGLMLARQGNVAEAMEQLNEAVRINPESAEAHNNLGLVLLASGQPRESLPHFAAALRLKPDLAAAQENMKRAQARLGSAQP